MSDVDWTQARLWSAVAILVALLVWESIAPFFAFFHGGKRAAHGLRNVLFGVLNAVVIGILFVALWSMASVWSEAQAFGLLHWFALPAPVRIVGAVLVFDAWMYGWHRLNHRMPFLWRFHRMHHSDPHMDVTTANRFHPGEIVMSSILRIPVIALIGMRLEELALYEMLMFAVVQFHHANIAVPPRIDRWLRAVIVTPFMHKVHHSRLQPETDSNYSSLLSIWDRLFRSFRLRHEPHGIQFGLDEWDAPQHQDLKGMTVTPFKNPKS